MIKLYNEFILEMANISILGKKVFADDSPLKNMNFDQLEDNIVLYVEKTGNFFWPKGKLFLFFTDSLDTTKKICNGEYDFLTFPIRTNYNLFTVAPITDIWKKKYTNKFKGADHILGIIEGWTDNKKILIEMMSVRKNYQHNKINTIMLDTLKNELKTDNFIWEDPTDEGYDFITRYDPIPKFKWNSSYRPKKFPK